MPSRPAHRAGSRPHTIIVWRNHVRVTFWWRGRFRGIGLPLWEVFSMSGPLPVLLSRGKSVVPAKPVLSAGGDSGAQPGIWKASMPHLAGWVTDAAYPDGEPMGAVQLQLKREGSIVRATLKIADQGGIKVSAVGETPPDALLSLDLLLGSPQCPWERDPYPLGSSAKKKK